MSATVGLRFFFALALSSHVCGCNGIIDSRNSNTHRAPAKAERIDAMLFNDTQTASFHSIPLFIAAMLPKAGTMHNFEHAYLRLLSHLINHYRRHNGTEHNKARLNEKKQPQQQQQQLQRRRRILTIDEEKKKKAKKTIKHTEHKSTTMRSRTNSSTRTVCNDYATFVLVLFLRSFSCTIPSQQSSMLRGSMSEIYMCV